MGGSHFRDHEAPLGAYRQGYLGQIIHDSQKSRTDDSSMKRQKPIKVKEKKPPDPASRHHLKFDGLRPKAQGLRIKRFGDAIHFSLVPCALSLTPHTSASVVTRVYPEPFGFELMAERLVEGAPCI
jgi:hypothetical protein